MKLKLILPVLAFLAISCSKEKNESSISTNDSAKIDTENTKEQDSPVFDIQKIPISNHELAVFPYFNLPQDLKEQNKPINRNYDMLFFPIDGKMTKVEGKVYKSYIVTSSDNYKDWSFPYFQKSYDDAITEVGGVKVFEGKISSQELDRIKDEARYFGEEGSIDYWNEPVSVYIIRRENGDDVYIQISGNTSSGAIQILQKEAFKQTITMITAQQISKDLADKGKAVLHINFDTDKATLKEDGQKTVDEIAKALSEDQNLKIAINGYTDNAGTADHNVKLSKKRAETVKLQLEQAGINGSRLTYDGFGQMSPIADNSTESGKAQNRRVELVKK